MTLKKLAVIVFPAIALAFATSGHAQAGLVENGSFETATTFNDSKQTFDQAGVTGWSGGSNLTYLAAPGTSDGPYLAVYSGLPATSPDGGNFVEADGDPNYSSTISQTLTGLTVGQAYAVSFFQAAGQQAGFTGPTTEEWKVGLGSDYQYSSQFSLAQGAARQLGSADAEFHGHLHLRGAELPGSGHPERRPADLLPRRRGG